MQANELEDVIKRIESVEEDVLRFIEDDPQLIRSRSTLDVLRSLKEALGSLRSVRGQLGGMDTSPGALESFHCRILRKPH